MEYEILIYSGKLPYFTLLKKMATTTHELLPKLLEVFGLRDNLGEFGRKVDVVLWSPTLVTCLVSLLLHLGRGGYA